MKDLEIRGLPGNPFRSERPARDAVAFWEEVLLGPYYVYFIQEAKGGPVKIGRARHPFARRDELQCGNPRWLCVTAVLVGPASTEARLHRAFASYRGAGEWFGCGLQDVIVTAAIHAMHQQIEWYREGKPLQYVKDHAPTLIMKPNTVIEVAA